MSDDMDWGFEDTKPSEVTISELTNLCEELKSWKASKKRLEDDIKEINKRMKRVESKILSHLDEHGMKNFSGDFGMVSRRKNYSVKQPNTPEAKEKFFDYLREQGIFESMVSVNSKTLQSYVRQEIEAKKEEGVEDFVPPGIDRPEITETVTLRKS